MKKQISAAVFAAVFTIALALSAQAEEQPFINNRDCLSGSALVTDFEDEENRPEAVKPFEAEPEEALIGSEEPQSFNKESADIGPKPVLKEFSDSDIILSCDENETVSIYTSDLKPRKALPVNADEIEADEEPASPSDDTKTSVIETSPENEPEPEGSSDVDDENSYSDSSTGSVEAEAPSHDGFSDDITKAPHRAEGEEKKAEVLSAPERRSFGLSIHSSGKKYSGSQVSEASAPNGIKISENENIINTGEELAEQADPERGTITFDNDGAFLEIPIDFIEQNSIEKDDVVSVSINRRTDAVNVNVKVNEDEVNEIEGAKIILPEKDGSADILPADSLGEIYISGSYNSALWPLGNAFPFVMALVYILLMGGAAAAVWKKIKSM